VCKSRVSVGFTRVGRVSDRTARSTGFCRVNSPPGFYLDPDWSQARVGRVPGRPAGPVRISKLCSLVYELGLIFISAIYWLRQVPSKTEKRKRKRKKEFTGQIHLGIKLLFSLLLSWKDLERYMCRGFLTFLLDRLFRTSLPWWFRVFSWNCHKPFIHIRTQLYLPATTQITGIISSDPFLPPRSKINIF